MNYNFDNSYSRLPAILYKPTTPTSVPNPDLWIFNEQLADTLGLYSDTTITSNANKDNNANRANKANILSGNSLPKNATPIAQAYAGHQFGNFTILGDGRAILLGEQITPANERFDVQLKGSGPTPFSRRGDGRAALGPMLREYIISEAMHSLGIPTTRSLAVVTTGEYIRREEQLQGAVLTRIAASHIRIGTFEYLAAHGDTDTLKILTDYTILRHYPELSASSEAIYLKFLYAVIKRQAKLIAQWLQVGFIHGVMNTDNMAISGETIDYGPCAFIDIYDPNTVFSSIDMQGRYAYINQANIAQWNLARFAETLLPLLSTEQNQDQVLQLAQDAIASFSELFQHYWLAGMRLKLGLTTAEADDISLVDTLLHWMQQRKVDYTNLFRSLSLGNIPTEIKQDAAFNTWFQRWQTRLNHQAEPPHLLSKLMQRHNPAVIPRNHRVEIALQAATEGNKEPVNNLLRRLAAPYDYQYENQATNLQTDHTDYSLPPKPSNEIYQTFCGT